MCQIKWCDGCGREGIQTHLTDRIVMKCLARLGLRSVLLHTWDNGYQTSVVGSS